MYKICLFNANLLRLIVGEPRAFGLLTDERSVLILDRSTRMFDSSALDYNAKERFAIT